MRWYCTICFAILIIIKAHNPAYGQTGFYLVVPCNENTPTQQKVLFYEYTPVCIVNQPVLRIGEIASISALHELPALNAAYFEIQLSETAYYTLKELSSKISNADFALAVEGEVLFITNYSTTEVFRVIRVYRTTAPQSLKLLHTKLKYLVGDK